MESLVSFSKWLSKWFTVAVILWAAFNYALPTTSSWVIPNTAYLLGLILFGMGLVFSGLVLWKPVQCSLLSTLLGGYEAARYIHFLCMSAMTLFIVIHLLMALLVPRTLLAMLRGC